MIAYGIIHKHDLENGRLDGVKYIALKREDARWKFHVDFMYNGWNEDNYKVIKIDINQITKDKI